MQCPRNSGPALALKNLSLPPGVFKVKREESLLRVLCWQRLWPLRMIEPHQACCFCCTQQLGLENDDQVRFKSLENGLLFLSVLIKVKAFYFLVQVWFRQQEGPGSPPPELLLSRPPPRSPRACIPGGLTPPQTPALHGHPYGASGQRRDKGGAHGFLLAIHSTNARLVRALTWALGIPQGTNQNSCPQMARVLVGNRQLK